MNLDIFIWRYSEMTLNLERQKGGKVLEVHASQKLTAKDYEHFLPEVERSILAHGKMNILFVMDDFHGWTAGALGEDVKFAVKHFNDIDRVAMVGENKWQELMSMFCKMFTMAEVRYFTQDRKQEAQSWLESAVANQESEKT
jgi:hypothetical protein